MGLLSFAEGIEDRKLRAAQARESDFQAIERGRIREESRLGNEAAIGQLLGGQEGPFRKDLIAADGLSKGIGQQNPAQQASTLAGLLNNPTLAQQVPGELLATQSAGQQEARLGPIQRQQLAESRQRYNQAPAEHNALLRQREASINASNAAAQKSFLQTGRVLPEGVSVSDHRTANDELYTLNRSDQVLTDTLSLLGKDLDFTDGAVLGALDQIGKELITVGQGIFDSGVLNTEGEVVFLKEAFSDVGNIKHLLSTRDSRLMEPLRRWQAMNQQKLKIKRDGYQRIGLDQYLDPALFSGSDFVSKINPVTVGADGAQYMDIDGQQMRVSPVATTNRTFERIVGGQQSLDAISGAANATADFAGTAASRVADMLQGAQISGR